MPNKPETKRNFTNSETLNILRRALLLLLITSALCSCQQRQGRYADFLSSLCDSCYYAVDTISGHEILLVSTDVFSFTDTANTQHQEATSAQLYILDGKGKIIPLGEVRSQGTAYPLAIAENGTLLAAGHHFVNRYSLSGNPISMELVEYSCETFDATGHAQYEYENRETNEYSIPDNSQKLDSLFSELQKSRAISFKHIIAERKKY